jgi:hypothetical protein
MLQNETISKQIANYTDRWLAVNLYLDKTDVCRIYKQHFRRKMLDLFVFLVLLTQNATRNGCENLTSHTTHH